jgi:segregation and condensation protein B
MSDTETPTPGLSLLAIIENLLFVADEPVTVARLAQATETSAEQIEAALAALNADGAERGLRLQRKGDKLQLVTHPDAAPVIERFLGLEATSKLSAAALETLAVVAYQQPCTRAQIEAVRGVNCDSVLKNLLSKGLIEELGRLETVGHPILYGTTFEFLQHFGLNNLTELPPLLPAEAETMEALAAQDQPQTDESSAPSPETSPVAQPQMPQVEDQTPPSTEPPAPDNSPDRQA